MALRQLGNDKFKAGEYEEAEELYTQASASSNSHQVAAANTLLQYSAEQSRPEALLEPSTSKAEVARLAGSVQRHRSCHRAVRAEEGGGRYEAILLQGAGSD